MSTRVFEKLTSAGFVAVSPHDLRPGDAFRVRDGVVILPLARELGVDPMLYMVARVAPDGVHFPIRVANGSFVDKVATFDDP